MKSKRGQLKSRNCGPGCSEKQYSEIRRVTGPAEPVAIGSPRNPPPLNASHGWATSTACARASRHPPAFAPAQSRAMVSPRPPSLEE